MPKVSAIVAFDEAGVMGRDNSLPWYLPEDFRHFKKTTMGCPVIMGRKTWDSLPRKPLPGRLNIVLSSRPIELPVGAEVVTTFHQALLVAIQRDAEEVFLLGGGEVFRQSFEKKLVDRLVVSHVKGKHEGDVYFPGIPEYLSVITPGERFAGFEVVEYTR